MADQKMRGYTVALVLAVAGVVAILVGLAIEADGARGGVIGLGGGLLGMAAVIAFRAAYRG